MELELRVVVDGVEYLLVVVVLVVVDFVLVVVVDFVLVVVVDLVVVEVVVGAADFFVPYSF